MEPRYMREVTNIHYRGSTAKVNLALKNLPPFRGVSNVRRLGGHVSISPTLEYLERA
jgi:hypothetical protein